MADGKDLVERLREWASGDPDPVSIVLREAAAEIQRLRVELAYMDDIARCRGEENERLRRIVLWWRRGRGRTDASVPAS